MSRRIAPPPPATKAPPHEDDATADELEELEAFNAYVASGKYARDVMAGQAKMQAVIKPGDPSVTIRDLRSVKRTTGLIGPAATGPLWR